MAGVGGEVGDALREETRERDICGRFGGDEFAVAERIRRRVHSLVVEIPGDDVGQDAIEVADLTVSIGAALFPTGGIEDVDDLLRRADAALYEAKRGGRDCTCLSPPPDLIPTQPAGS